MSKNMRLTRAGTLLIPFVCISFLVTGCAKRKPPVAETEAAPQKIVLTEKQTEPPTEKHTEPPTEKKISPKDIQVMVPKTTRNGKSEYQITTGSGELTGALTFVSTSDAFLGTVSEDKAFYTGKDGSLSNAGNGWTESESSFMDFWNKFYEAEYKENIELGGVVCCKYTIETEDPVGQVNGIAEMEGYEDVMSGDTTINFYVSSQTNDILRVDGKTTFMGEKNGNSEQGQVAVVYIPNSTETVTIKKPEAVEKETEIVDDYEPGYISEETNTYKNATFNIQIVGNDLFYFDAYKTEELEDNYKAANSPYVEEAYAQGDGVILNISTTKKNAATASACLSKYLTDSKAENIQASTPLNVDNTSYITSTATINNTTTKNYCAESDDRVIIITLYYQNEETVAAFESSIYTVDADPFWQEEEWTLEGIYTLKTPKGYSIVNGNSGDLYVTMKSENDELTVFAIADSTIDEEVSEESTTSSNVTRTLITEDQLPLSDGSNATYLVVKNEEPAYKYYTYIGLVQKDANVIKIYLVSTKENADYKQVFTEISNGISADIQTDDGLQVDTETAMEDNQPDITIEN